MNHTIYETALAGAVLHDEANYGRIRMRGTSAADLLHRLSTNEIVKLRPHQGARTVLTTPISRIIDLLTVYVLEDSLVVVTGPEQGGSVFNHLRKNIFFNDKATLEPMGRSHVQLTLYGPAAAQVLGTDLADLPLHHTRSIPFANHDLLVARTLPIGGQGFRLLVPAEAAAAVQAALHDAGVATLDAATFDTLRVEQGYGAVGRELSQDYIPLETELDDAISFTKGCYVGQEIIARMESRGRRAKVLRGLRLTPGVRGQGSGVREDVQLPTKLVVDGKEAGDVTSVVDSPRFGLIGLAYVRTAYADTGTAVGVSGGDAVGEVVALPFG